jgi:hypothetical protein
VKGIFFLDHHAENDAHTATEYELYYRKARGEKHPDEGKPIGVCRMDKERHNDLFCMSEILYSNPNGAPEDEVAMLCIGDGTGIMMEWERPISMLCHLAILLVHLCDVRILSIITPHSAQKLPASSGWHG